MTTRCSPVRAASLSRRLIPWCRDCDGDFTNDCASAGHRACSQQQRRAERVEPQLQQLQVGGWWLRPADSAREKVQLESSGRQRPSLSLLSLLHTDTLCTFDLIDAMPVPLLTGHAGCQQPTVSALFHCIYIKWHDRRASSYAVSLISGRVRHSHP